AALWIPVYARTQASSALWFSAACILPLASLLLSSVEAWRLAPTLAAASAGVALTPLALVVLDVALIREGCSESSI
ncbi:MAG: hypothetical protein DRK00_07285, partial [Thermoprotei archaeon]